MGTSVERASAVKEIRQKAEGYGMKNEQVNGMNVLDVYDAARQAIEYVRKEEQPYFLEVDTYRFRGHSMGDPERYRKAEEVKKWQENDPIGIFNKYLLDNKKATRKALEKIEARVEEEVANAVKFAEESPEPAMEELFTDVYVDN
jgi:pyruvate dehydrogenase E1 component alpha subunit